MGKQYASESAILIFIDCKSLGRAGLTAVLGHEASNVEVEEIHSAMLRLLGSREIQLNKVVIRNQSSQAPEINLVETSSGLQILGLLGVLVRRLSFAQYISVWLRFS